MSKERREVRLRAGVRVRVRQDADDPHAGQEGVVLFAGDKVCDVKFFEKGRGASGRRRKGGLGISSDGPTAIPVHQESRIDTVLREHLESTRRNVHLVGLLSFHKRNPQGIKLTVDDGKSPLARRKTAWIWGLALTAFVVASILFWLAGG